MSSDVRGPVAAASPVEVNIQSPVGVINETAVPGIIVRRRGALGHLPSTSVDARHHGLLHAQQSESTKLKETHRRKIRMYKTKA